MNVDFQTYLKRSAHTESTIESYSKIVDKFLLWCNQKGYQIETINYNKCTEYIRFLKNQKRGLKDRSIQHYIGVVRQYFNFLVAEEYILLNPIPKDMYHADRDYHHDFLSQVELEELYYDFKTQNLEFPNCKSAAIRNKVVTGLIVFQGLSSRDIKNLKVEHIDLERSEISVPGTKKTNSRKLKLESCQIYTLIKYLQQDIYILQKKINNYSEALFPRKGNRISSITSQVAKKLKHINLKVTGLNQLRASVITIWVTKHDLRKVQIMAGHKYISTTEKYKRNDLRELEEELEMYHPVQ